MSTSIIPEKIKKAAVQQVVDGQSKASVGRQYGVSSRTIGRWVDKYGSIKTEEPKVETAPPEIEYSFVLTPGSLLVSKTNKKTGECELESINSNDDRFDRASMKLWADHTNEKVIEDVFNEISNKEELKRLFVNGDITIDMSTQKVKFSFDSGYEIELSQSLAGAIIESHKKQSRDFDRLCRFAERVSMNPSNKASLGAFDFIRAMDIEIDDGGYLLCFKKVTEDYKDCYTRTFDNTPGSFVSVPRNQVDEDSSRVCSKGLHVASRAYLSHYYGAKVVLCRVDPKDIVSVPDDYYSVTDGGEVKAKMRVCEYFVVEDVTDEIM